MAHTGMQETMTVGDIPWLETSPSVDRIASTHGTPVASIIASWTIRGRRTSLENPKPRAPRFSHTRILRAWSLASTLIWATSARCIRFVAAKNGSSCVRCSGMGGSNPWNRLIGLRGRRSSDFCIVPTAHEHWPCDVALGRSTRIHLADLHAVLSLFNCLSSSGSQNLFVPCPVSFSQK